MQEFDSSQRPPKFSLFFLLLSLYSLALEFTHFWQTNPTHRKGELLWEVSARADIISRASSSLLWLAVTTPSVSLEQHWFSSTKKFSDFTSFTDSLHQDSQHGYFSIIYILASFHFNPTKIRTWDARLYLNFRLFSDFWSSPSVLVRIDPLKCRPQSLVSPEPSFLSWLTGMPAFWGGKPYYSLCSRIDHRENHSGSQRQY